MYITRDDACKGLEKVVALEMNIEGKAGGILTVLQSGLSWIYHYSRGCLSQLPLQLKLLDYSLCSGEEVLKLTLLRGDP